MKAKLIKRGESEKTPQNKEPEAPTTPRPSATVTIVRDWVGQHQKVQRSARQSFAALFAESEMSGAT